PAPGRQDAPARQPDPVDAGGRVPLLRLSQDHNGKRLRPHPLQGHILLPRLQAAVRAVQTGLTRVAFLEHTIVLNELQLGGGGSLDALWSGTYNYDIQITRE